MLVDVEWLRLEQQRRLKIEIEHRVKTLASGSNSIVDDHAVAAVAEFAIGGIAVVNGFVVDIEIGGLDSRLHSRLVNERIGFDGVVGNKNCVCRS
jgi:hypothetical protein